MLTLKHTVLSVLVTVAHYLLSLLVRVFPVLLHGDTANLKGWHDNLQPLPFTRVGER